MLYHYCSNEAFVSIIWHQSIWLSLLTLSNDTSEGRHVRSVMSDLLESSEYRMQIMGAVDTFSEGITAIGFCLSKKGDLLSQWRGYADDARGVAIGFNEDVLGNLCDIASAVPSSDNHSDNYIFHLREIVYKRTEQEAQLKRNVDALINFLRDNKIGPAPDYLPKRRQRRGQTDKHFDLENSNIYPVLLNLVLDCFLIKSDFFMEEAESRLLAVLDTSPDGAHWAECGFRARTDRVVPYLEFPAGGFSPNAITEVILGPRNNTPINVVEAFLRKHKFKYAKVVKSSGTFR